eukprot:5059134-Prymnesium_polylepis.1
MQPVGRAACDPRADATTASGHRRRGRAHYRRVVCRVFSRRARGETAAAAGRLRSTRDTPRSAASQLGPES